MDILPCHDGTLKDCGEGTGKLVEHGDFIVNPCTEHYDLYIKCGWKPVPEVIEDCPCVMDGSDGTTKHNEPSGYKCVYSVYSVLTGNPKYFQPCCNHLEGYIIKGWEPELIQPVEKTKVEVNKCGCKEPGADGTKEHNQPSRLIFKFSKILLEPCDNHVDNYYESVWELVDYMIGD